MEDCAVFQKRCQEVLGIALVSIALFILISITGYTPADYPSLLAGAPAKNMAGSLGAWMAHFTRSAFGVASYCIVPVLVIPGLFLVNNEWVHNVTEKSIILILLTVAASAVMPLFSDTVPQLSGGYAGILASGFFIALFGRTASYILVSILIVINVVILVILFVAPGYERLRVPSLLKERIAHFFRRKKHPAADSCAGSTLDQGSVKFPWIVKKKIVVYETEKIEGPDDALKFPELPDLSGDGMECRGADSIARQAGDVRLLEEPATDPAVSGEKELVLGEDEYIVDAVDGNVPGEGEESPEERCGCQAEDMEDPGSMEAENAGGEYAGNAAAESDELETGAPMPVLDTTLLETPKARVFDEIRINEEYIIPKTYLSSSKPLDAESWKNEIRKNSILLKNTLAEFGIEADVVNVNRGPVITLYEMQIAPGIKVNRVVGLADDIAMALAAQRVRIVAPIPGKSAIGVEIPNLYRETVTLGDIIKSKEFQNYEGSLVVALGKDILGKPVMLDLKKQPHLLIAGTTGSGKSVCVNSIITSLLYNYNPNYVRFILVDPKMVELQLYNGLPHLLTPVIVDPQIAPMVLKWTMREMERRYYLLSEMNTRDIERYNEKIGRQRKNTERLPYIVVIIDEMADLMMSSKEVEGYITRIAQKSRAVGIHLVVATQRPSVDIITGLIKANFPARVAFQVAQKTDSRTIIDQNGAEKLLGRGDMLYQPPTSSFPIRVQGGFISEDEIEKITGHLCRLGKPSYIDIEESLVEDEESGEMEEASDELFQEALKIIEETKKASASYLQRRLSIGYNRAARIIEQMEDMGYIGPQIGSKPREVFV